MPANKFDIEQKIQTRNIWKAEVLKISNICFNKYNICLKKIYLLILLISINFVAFLLSCIKNCL